jgi:Bacterial regulatory proteins, gntR family
MWVTAAAMDVGTDAVTDLDEQGPHPDADDAPDPGQAPDVLTLRIAAATLHNDPGWLLPRPSTLARRYGVSTAAVRAALDELAALHVLRRSGDGRYSRSGPADYLLAITCMSGIGIRIRLLSGELACRSLVASRHSVRDDVERVLQMTSGEVACVLRTLWTADEVPAAARITTVVPGLATRFAVPTCPQQPAGDHSTAGYNVLPPPLPGAHGDTGPGIRADQFRPGAITVETQPPPPWAARGLNLQPGEPASIITIRIDERASARPAALAVTVARADLFKVTAASAGWQQAARIPFSAMAP